jgi:rubredoxin
MGDPKSTEHDELFITKEQIVNSMNNQEPLILINNTEKNPVYRMLVQTPEELEASDMGFDKIKYSEEGIKNNINGLLGEYIYDKTQSNHGKVRDGVVTETKFAQIVNTDYCPNYGGYVDFEVFNHGYVPMVEQALNSRLKGLPVKEGPSTEMVPSAGEKYDDNSLLLTDWTYNGIVWDKNPRDVNTGVCSVVLNSLPENIGGDNVTDKTKIELTKDEYDELTKAKNDLGELQTKYDNLKPEDFKEYQELETEKNDLYNQMIPVWTQQGELKEQMLNSILERVPEADKKSMKEKLEKKEFSELKDMIIVNSFEMPTGDEGVLGGGEKPPGSGELTADQKEWQKAQELLKNGANKNIV